MKIDKAYRPELVVSKGKEPNPLLTDPYLDATEDRLVATDGRALVALPVETKKGERSRYLACSLLAAARGLGDADVPAEIDDQEIVEFGVLWPAAQERTFPDWQKLVPRFKRGDVGTMTIALNARLLKALADAMGSAGGVALTFDPSRKEDPILVQPISLDAVEFGLLMPMREDDEEEVGPGPRGPACRKLLAAGAACPEHGRPEATEEVLEAAAALGRAKDGTRVSVSVNGGKEVDLTALAEKRDAAKRASLEGKADEILREGGSGHLTKKADKGPAVARKKARRS